MGIAYISNDNNAYTASPVAVAYPSANQAGSLLVAGILIENTTGSVSGITDTRNGSGWTLAKAFHGSFVSLEIWYCPNSVAGSNTVSVSITGGSAKNCVMIGEYSGAALVSPLDKTAAQNTSGTSALTSGSATTSANNELVYGMAAQNSGGFASAGTGFTRRQTFSFNYYQQNEDGIFPAGSNAATFTSPGTPTATIIMATFKPPSSSRMMLLGVG